MIGKTSVQRNTLNPTWNPPERFVLTIPFYQSLSDASIMLEAFDYDDLSDADLLGIRALSSEESRRLIEGNFDQLDWKDYFGEVNALTKSIYLPLYNGSHYATGMDLARANKQDNKRSLGDLELSLSPLVESEVKDSAGKDKVYRDSFSAFQEEFSQSAHPIEKMEIMRCQKFLTLYIVSAKNLANADTFGKSDPFMKIYWNGVLLGQTSTIYETLNPFYYEKYQLVIPSYVSLSHCELRLDVFDEDNYIGGDFLGTAAITGNDLAELASYSSQAFHKHESSVNSKMQDLYDAAKSFNLQKSNLFSKKGNKFVKGSIQLLLREEEHHNSLVRDFVYVKTSATNNADRKSEEKVSLNVREVMEENPFFSSALTGLKLQWNMCQVVKIDRNSTKKSSFRPDSPKRPVSPPGKGENAATKKSGKEAVYMILSLNGELLYKIAGVYNLDQDTIEFSDSAPVVVPQDALNKSNGNQGVARSLVLPTGLDLIECCFTLQLFDESGQKLLSTAYLHGDKVNGCILSKTSKSAMLDVLFRPLPVTTASRPPSPSLSSSSSSSGLSLLMKLSVLPIYKQDEVKRDKVSAPSRIMPYEHIHTSLADGKLAWRHIFQSPDDEKEGDIMNDYMSRAEPKSRPGSGEEAKAAIIPSRLVNARGARGAAQAISDAAAAPGGGKPISSAHPFANTAEDGPIHVPAVTYSRMFAVEVAAVNFTVTIKSRLEEAYRVYWRGKVTPLQVTFANAKQKRTLYASRSSRLIKTHSLYNLNVEADVHYLTEVTEEEERANEDLPLCVKEVLTESPGLVCRVFRLELYTNTAILLGSVDLEDSVKDFMCVLGPGGRGLLPPLPN
ncbi:hypothetical protein EON65_27255, partial [archaeon]